MFKIIQDAYNFFVSTIHEMNDSIEELYKHIYPHEDEEDDNVDTYRNNEIIFNQPTIKKNFKTRYV